MEREWPPKDFSGNGIKPDYYIDRNNGNLVRLDRDAAGFRMSWYEDGKPCGNVLDCSKSRDYRLATKKDIQEQLDRRPNAQTRRFLVTALKSPQSHVQ
jgi:hypothetical protein